MEGPLLLGESLGQPHSDMQLWCTRGWLCQNRLFRADPARELDVLQAPTKSIGRARGSRSQHCLLPWLTLLLFVFMFLLCENVVICTDVLAGHGTEAARGRPLSCLGGDPPERQEPRQRAHHPLSFSGR